MLSSLEQTSRSSAQASTGRTSCSWPSTCRSSASRASLLYRTIGYLLSGPSSTLRVSNAIHSDFPDLVLPSRSLAGVLYIPLVYGGQDFLALVRRECVKRVRWAEWSPRSNEQPRQPQLMVRTQVTEGEAMPWTEEQLQVASALALVSKRVRYFTN